MARHNRLPQPAKPRTLGHFELVEQLGVGHFGSVWKAKDTTLDRFVAVEIPRNEQLDETDIDKFFREARAAAQLRHPNIVAVHEVGREGNSPTFGLKYSHDSMRPPSSRARSSRLAVVILIELKKRVRQHDTVPRFSAVYLTNRRVDERHD